MNLDVILHFWGAEPFEPIEFRLANGDRHQVRDPINMAVGKNVVVILYPDSNRMAHCTPHQVVSIEKLVAVEDNGGAAK
jgi:hypothetical protein